MSGQEISSDGVAQPTIVCIRGPSCSGKTAMAERLIAGLSTQGHRVAYVKWSYDEPDLQDSSSMRIWHTKPVAMVRSGQARVDIMYPQLAGPSIEDLLAYVPGAADIILIETHQPERYPTLLARVSTPEPGEQILQRWDLNTMADDAADAIGRIAALRR